MLLIIFSILTSFGAQATSLEPFRYLAHPLDASFNAANLIAGDAPRPMDDAIEGKWLFSIAPTYFSVDQAYQTTDGDGGGALVRGEDLHGWALSGAFGYGLTDRWQLYGLVTYLTMDGKMFGRVPGNAAADQFMVEGENSVSVMNVGMGFDTMPETSSWRIPVFFGLFLRHYNTDLTNTPLAGSTEPYTEIEGSGVRYGWSIGVQASKVFFEKLKVMPYTFVGFNRTGPKVKVKVTNTNGNSGFQLGQTVEDELETYPFPVAGLSIGWVPWGMEFSVSGPITSLYSESIYDGLQLTRYTLTFNIVK